VLWSSAPEEQDVFAAIGAGVSGYLLRRTSGEDLVSGLRAVAQHGNLLDPTLMGTVFDRLRRIPDLADDDRLSRLSPRERRILELVATGQTNREIAEAVHLSEKTVKNHLTHVLAKLGVARRSEAAAYYASVARG
jgi:DNA-binding NarL/FixJ family response regulator